MDKWGGGKLIDFQKETEEKDKTIPRQGEKQINK